MSCGGKPSTSPRRISDWTFSHHTEPRCGWFPNRGQMAVSSQHVAAIWMLRQCLRIRQGQMAVSSQHVAAIWMLRQCLRIRQAVTGPFWYIITRLLSAITRHHFDDFPTVGLASDCKVLSLAFSAILDMLGWHHAKDGDKASNFAVAFDLRGSLLTRPQFQLVSCA